MTNDSLRYLLQILAATYTKSRLYHVDVSLVLPNDRHTILHSVGDFRRRMIEVETRKLSQREEREVEESKLTR